VPQIEVTFDIDANGIVHVSAKDRGTGKEQSMTITGQSQLNKDEIARMVRDAETHAEEDRRRREEAEVRNQADALVYQTERMLRDYGDKVSVTEKATIEQALTDTKKALQGKDLDELRTAHEKLVYATQNAAQKIYEGAGTDGAAQGGGGFGGPSDDDVVDAEIVDG
jgi:molecular chaperone DnaK